MRAIRRICISAKQYGELSVLLSIITVFLISAAVSPLPSKQNFGAMVFYTILFGGALSICFLKYCGKKQRKKYDSVVNRIYHSKEIIIVLLFVALTRAVQLGTTPRWDSEYYLTAILNGCKNFDFTISSFITSFRLCGHTSFGYSLFLGTGAYLNPTGVYGINCINLILVLFFTYFLYEILRYLFPGASKLSAAAGTFLILSEPLACGTFGNINIDFPVMIFSIYLVFMHIRKYYLLLCFFGIILMESKEVGIIVVIGYAGVCLLLTFAEELINKKFHKIFNKKRVWFLFFICVCLFCFLYALTSGQMDSWSDGVQFGADEENQSHYFAFVPEYIILKLKMIFLMNFYWLFSLLITVILCYTCLQTKKKQKNRTIQLTRAYPLLALGGGLTALLLFNCLYVTWSNPRYHYALQTGLFLLFVIVILGFIKSKRAQQGIFLCLAFICLCQSYTTLDAVTAGMFQTRDTGSHFPVAHPAWNANDREYAPMSILKDMAVYNNQLGYMDKAYDQILEKVKYHEAMDIVIWDNLPGYNGFSVSSINAYWNSVKKKRTFAPGENTIPVNMVYPDNIRRKSEQGSLNEEAVYICTKSYGIEEEEALKELAEYYTIGEKQTVTIFMQGRVNYYILGKQ